MKTLGERIRQAREAKGWSGEFLAKKVGYKTQSGISNLEGRATGSGGNKIGMIAKALDVSLDWLMHGPDSDVVPFLTPHFSSLEKPLAIHQVNEPVGVFRLSDRQPQFDEWTLAAIAIMTQLNQDQKLAMVGKMREFRQHLGPASDGQALFVAG